MSELKPCPFCGSKNVGVDTKYADMPESGYSCTCLEVNCHGNIYTIDGYYPTPEAAIEAWNKRA